MTKISKAKKSLSAPITVPVKGDNGAKSNAKQFLMKPYQQGSFDGFCSIYSIINALRLVGNRTIAEFRKQLDDYHSQSAFV